MVGVAVEPSALHSAAGAAAKLGGRRMMPRRVPAKRSWPPGCGRFSVPPPPPLAAPAAAGDGEKVEDGRAGETIAAAAVPPTSQNGDPPPQGQGKVVEAAAPTFLAPAAQSGALPQQGQNKADEAVASAAFSPVECNRERDKGQNGEVGPVDNGTDAALLDDKKGKRAAHMVVTVMIAPESSIAGARSSAKSGGEGAGLLAVEKEHGGGGDVRDEAAGDTDGREIGNRSGEGELERKMDGVEVIRKRRLTSTLSAPPMRRVESAVHIFPPGCGVTAVSTNGNGVSEVSPIRAFPPGCDGSAVTTDGSRVLELSPVRTSSPGCGRAAVTTDDTEILEVLPTRTYPPGHRRAAVTTIGSGYEKRMPLGATPVNGDASSTEALAALPDSGEATNEKGEGNRVVEEGSSKAHSKILESRVASDTFLIDFVTRKQANDQPPNSVPKASPKHGFT